MPHRNLTLVDEPIDFKTVLKMAERCVATSLYVARPLVCLKRRNGRTRCWATSCLATSSTARHCWEAQRSAKPAAIFESLSLSSLKSCNVPHPRVSHLAALLLRAHPPTPLLQVPPPAPLQVPPPLPPLQTLRPTPLPRTSPPAPLKRVNRPVLLPGASPVGGLLEAIHPVRPPLAIQVNLPQRKLIGNQRRSHPMNCLPGPRPHSTYHESMWSNCPQETASHRRSVTRLCPRE